MTAELLRLALWVALGSALGGMARFFVSGFVGRRIGETFPWGTMAVNVSGAFVIGLIVSSGDMSLPAMPSAGWAFGISGFLGSYTTVSSFSLQTLALAREGDMRRAGANVILSLALCLGAAAIGLLLGNFWAQAR
jgi:fluoride exporter